MDQKDIFLAMGKFEAKITSLEDSVGKLESSVFKLTQALENVKAPWKALLSVMALVSLVGAVIHKPLEVLMSLFK